VGKLKAELTKKGVTWDWNKENLRLKCDESGISWRESSQYEMQLTLIKKGVIKPDTAQVLMNLRKICLCDDIKKDLPNMTDDESRMKNIELGVIRDLDTDSDPRKPREALYVGMGSKRIGTIKEEVEIKFWKERGHAVEKRGKADHDYVVCITRSQAAKYRIKVEHKYTSGDVINHISLSSAGKKWDVIVIRMGGKEYIISKNKCKNIFNEDNKIFSHQQGGDDGKNDDYMITGPNVEKFLKHCQSLPQEFSEEARLEREEIIFNSHQQNL